MVVVVKDDKYENLVVVSVVEVEKILIEKGVSLKDVCEMVVFCVFGGVNGMYGMGIQEMVEFGDCWEDELEIVVIYFNNMGVYYGSEKNWEVFWKYVFEVVLICMDVVVQFC